MADRNIDAEVEVGRVKKQSWHQTNWNKMVLNVIILVGIFLAGIVVGDNRIKLGPDGIFRKSVQTSQAGPLDYDSVDEVYNSLIQGYDGQLDQGQLEDGLKAGLVAAAGDPYTEYFNQTAAKDFNEQLSGSFEGIGAELGKEDQAVVIISPISGFPAEKAGIRAGDIISKIDGESAYDITITDAVKKIRGQKGTKVKLEVVRDGEVKEFEITRDTINIPSVEYEINDDNVGVLTISRFGEDTVKLAKQAAQEFKDKNVKGVILDVRGDPGGLLDAAVGVSEIWLDNEATILEEKRGGETIDTYRAKSKPILKDVPTIVLVDGGSASASEIVAGALRDNGVAKLYGEKTYGKGSVQEVRNMSDGGLLKVTIARWFTPSGHNIDKEGLEPDKVVKYTEADRKAEKDPAMEAAVNQLK